MNTTSKPTALPVATAVVLRQVLSLYAQPAPQERRLARQAELVHRLARINRLDLPLLGRAPLFDGVKLIANTRPAWALYNLSQDPVYKQGRFPLPARDLRRLQRINKAGIHFEALAVAHELPATFRPGYDKLDPCLFIPAPPANATRLAAGLGTLADGMLSTCLAVMGKPLTFMAPAAAAVAAVLLDPILMGAVVPLGVDPQEGVPALWYLLAAWRW